jgi:hypothetical protein
MLYRDCIQKKFVELRVARGPDDITRPRMVAALWYFEDHNLSHLRNTLKQ